MSSHTFGQKKFIPTPPDRGSFPLDHENLCKRYYLLYMSCLRRSEDQSSECRKEVQEYLNCRMKNQLMEQIEWSKLGFSEENKKDKTKQQ